MTTIAIFGASGQTGKELTEQALKLGYEVKALVRNPARLVVRDPNLRVIQGDLTDPAKVDETVRGTEAVLSAIGAAKGSPSDIKAVAARNIDAAMQKYGVKRVIRLASAPMSVAEPGDAPSLGQRVMGSMMKALLPGAVHDERQSAVLTRQSRSDWTLVRAMAPLSSKPATGHVQAGHMGVEVNGAITRADLARFMLDELKNGQFVRQAPAVGS